MNYVSARRKLWVAGHRQWNDFYLVALSQRSGYLLATFDEAFAAHFPEHCKLVP